MIGVSKLVYITTFWHMFCPALWHVGGGVNFTVPVTIGENPIVTSVLIHVA